MEGIMKNMRIRGIKTKLVLWFITISLASLMILMYITYLQRVNVIQSRTFEKLTAIRDLKIQRLEDWLKERIGDIKTMSSDFELVEIEKITGTSVLNENESEILTNIRLLISRYLDNYDSYSEVFILHPSTGDIIVSTQKNSEGLNKANESYFTEPLKTKEYFIKDVHYSKSLARNILTYSIPIFKREKAENNIAGILVAQIDLKRSLYPILSERAGLGNTGETLIVNKEGMALNELRWHEDAPLNLKIVAKPALRAAGGKTGITLSKDYRGEEVMAAYAYIPEMQWGFVCKQDLYELNEPIRELGKNFIVLFIVASLLIYIMAHFVSRSVTMPIIDMNIMSQKIKNGDLSVRNKITSNDELGNLGNTINSMTASLETRIKIQESVSGISSSLLGPDNYTEFSSNLLKKLMELSGAHMAVFYTLDDSKKQFQHLASIGANTELLKPFKIENPEGELGKVISTGKISYIKDIQEDTHFVFKTSAGDIIPKELITIPIVIEDSIEALITLVSINKFEESIIDILGMSSFNINTSFKNIVTSDKTRLIAENLAESNTLLSTQSAELKQQSNELQEQNFQLGMQSKQVKEASRLKSEFLSNMSHELRTPLNSIITLSHVLVNETRKKLNEEENNYLKIVLRNGKRLLTLINDILDLSKIEAGKMDVVTKSISLQSFLPVISENIRPLADKKGLKISLEIPENLPNIKTDQDRLQQIISNLLGNAIKFTDKGSIHINVHNENELFNISIKDTGVGISEKDLLHIFDEFRQVDGSTSRQFGGTGLGLAIVHKLVKMLGGNIDVKSEVGKGSEFIVQLPHTWEGVHYDIKPITAPAPNPVSKKKTILVVDDDPNIVDEISNHFEKAGYNAIGCTSGSKALKLAELHRPLAITLDVIMPGMDGFEVLQKLKSKSETRDIPVIMVSISDNVETGFALGAVGYVPKPVDERVLLSEIMKLHFDAHKVMIVDDNSIDLDRLDRIISKENMSVIRAEGGKECLRLLEKSAPDILILDLIMPDIDGFQVIDAVRRSTRFKNLPIIIVTAKDLSPSEKEFLKGKVSSIIVKSDESILHIFEEIESNLKRLESQAVIKKAPGIKTRLLLVEDNKDAIIQMKTVLENEGYLLDVAMGGKQAIEYMSHTIPDGIILDLMMPEVDGFEVLNNIRGIEDTSGIPVLVLTAKDLTREDFQRLSTNNIQQLVQKGSVDIDELLFKIRLMLGNEPNPSARTKFVKKENVELTHEKTKVIANEKRDRPTILVVEDNPDNMITIKAVIKDKYYVIEATDGKMGLEMVNAHMPDLVLLDIALPKKDGIQVVNEIKKTPKTSAIPVIALTARAMKNDRELLLDAGCDEYVSKPIEYDVLLEKIKIFLK